MSRPTFGTWLHHVVGALASGSHSKERRPRVRRSPQLESLEGRALMATINASATISSVAVGNNFDYTVQLANSRTSNSGIGTFWYSWVPAGEDFLATSPISVTPPAGWTDTITHLGPSDGYAIQFVASTSAFDVQPGSSLNFSFVSTDSPASINGNSVDYPSTPVDTAVVYPGAPFSDAGHQFVVTPATTPTPTPSPAPGSAPPVTVVSVQDVKNKKHLVTEIVVDFSGPVNAAQADSVATYRLATANGKGSFTAKNSPVLKLRSAVFNPANDTVTLTPKKAFALTKAVELTIDGTAPSGLQDSSGQLIDGDDNGQAGSNAVALIRRSGVTLNPVAPAAKDPWVYGPPAVVPPASAPPVVAPGAPYSPVVFNPTTPASHVVVNPIPPAGGGGSSGGGGGSSGGGGGGSSGGGGGSSGGGGRSPGY
jgi:hypothetical protein